MDVGDILSGTQLLQGKEHTGYMTTTARRGPSNDVHVKQSIGYEDKLTKDQANKLVQQLNTFLEPVNTHVQYRMHEKLNEFYISIVDSNTDEVLREVPPKKLLDVYAGMIEAMGLLIDEKR
ncbi:flagellar protein FlaG [Pontibacillus halophilus JSM 076056 = DSM 19796]|uniref:Flagellar protein FlaG n=1 Tax=Pontibacillus halophilus JSM 076056 = DSM 19796 TaxID=1385510 RepID=A0A0A5GL18_9BACI|nr:flagellar protein FlaG [Pontibacillus halophilus]KGX93956.1 flagellar protein FlaG [Pontibacillus halophilus JSM 076056 = DSM 19796]